jgi:hypothetical protein
MSALYHWTDWDHDGGVDEEDTDDHEGSPERLSYVRGTMRNLGNGTDLIDVTSHPRNTAALHILLPDIYSQRLVHPEVNHPTCLGSHCRHRRQSSSSRLVPLHQ